MTPNDVIDALSDSLIEREDEAELLVVGLIARQNVLFVGPPGTAKSLIAENMIRAVGAKGFVQLMHKFLPPEELMGPVKLSELKQDRYERVVTGMLPEAEIAFLDEIWKSSPAILNTLLRILNERQFLNGNAGMIQCPMEFTIAASNEWPIGDGFETVGALFDRFLIRKSIRPVSKAARRKLLYNSVSPPNQMCQLSDVKAWQSQAKGLSFPDDVADAYDEIIDDLANQGVIVGDRRMRAAVGVVKAAAFVNGNSAVEKSDLEILKYCLWAVPDQELAVSEVVCRIANPDAWRITEILTESDQSIAKILDFSSPESFASAKKVESMIRELEVMSGNPRAVKAKDYIKKRLQELNQKMLGL